MNIFSLLSFSAFIIYLYFGIYVLKLEKKSKLNIVFFLMCLNFANWSFSYTFVYPETNFKIATMWYKMSTFGWCTVNSFLLHFFLILTEKDKKINKYLLYFSLYTPAIIFSYKTISDNLLLKTFKISQLGLIEVQYTNTAWTNAFIIYFITYLFLGFFILYKWGVNSQILRQKKQSKLIFYSAIFPVTVGLCTNIILPSLGLSDIPAIGQILVLLWIYAIWIAISKYKFLILTPDVASDEIFAKIKDLLIITDNNYNIVKVNPNFLNTFEYHETDLIGINITSIIDMENIKEHNIQRNISNCNNLEFNFISKNKNLIPINLSSEKIKNIAGDIAGTIFVGQDLRPIKQLIKEIHKRKKTEKDLVDTMSSLKNLLDNAGQGFLSFNSSLKIQQEYSLECETIFNKKIASCSFPELIYPDNVENINFLSELLTNILLSDDEDKKELFLSLLPTERIINDKFIHIEYKLLNNLNEPKFMVILTDITENKELENKIENERNILRMVVKVVTNYDLFYKLKEDYHNFITYDIPLLSNANINSNIFEIKRIFHNFKGNFAILEMQNTVDKLHILESKLEKLEKTPTKINNQQTLSILSKLGIESLLNDDYNTLISILGQEFFENKNLIQIEPDKIVAIEKKIISIFSANECTDILNDLRRLRYRNLHDLLHHYTDYVQKLANRLHKSINPLVLEGEEILVDPDRYQNFIRSLTHIFRNSVDHGIETADERLLINKNILGNIKCTYKFKNDIINITIEDDGKGIDIESIKEKAINKSIISKDEINAMTDSELFNLIFENGFSTKDIISEYSGRGIGLSAVKESVNKLQGEIYVESKSDKGTKFTINIPNQETTCDCIEIFDILNPFIDNIINLINDYGIDIKVPNNKKYNFYKSKNIELKDITTFIHIDGALDGMFMLSTTNEIAKKIAEKFILAKISPEEEEELTKDSIAEFLNTILGNSLYNLPDSYKNCTIKPPTLLTSKNCNVKYYVYTICSVKINDDMIFSFITDEKI